MPTIDRLKGSLAGIVRAAVAPADFFAEYSCEVVSQRGDGTLDLKPSTHAFRGSRQFRFGTGYPASK